MVFIEVDRGGYREQRMYCSEGTIYSFLGFWIFTDNTISEGTRERQVGELIMA
jgi:hypothetical protein